MTTMTTQGTPSGAAEAAASQALAPAADDVAGLPVQAVMTTRVLVAAPTDHLILAWELMTQAGVHHLPVVDGVRLVGMLDDRRLTREWATGPLSSQARTVGELIDHPPVQVRPDRKVRDAAALMAIHRLDAVCVTSPSGQLVGILTTADLVDALAGRRPAPATAGPPVVAPLLFRLTPVLPLPPSTQQLPT